MKQKTKDLPSAPAMTAPALCLHADHSAIRAQAINWKSAKRKKIQQTGYL